jgi:hypothetical protein
MEIYPFIPDNLTYINIKNLTVGNETVDVGWNKKNGKIDFDIRGKNIDSSKIIFRIASDKSDAVSINGKKIEFTAEKYYGVSVGKAEISIKN